MTLAPSAPPAAPPLIEHLLARRHSLPDGLIVDCIDLAVVARAYQGRRLPWDVLARRWGCLNRSYVSRRMVELSLAGLLDYERGCRGEPGYLINRVGPK